MKLGSRCSKQFTTLSNTIVNVQIGSIPILAPPTIQKFRTTYFNHSLPCLFPPSHFSYFPAIPKWFKPHGSLPNAQAINPATFRSVIGGRADLPVSLESTSADKNTFAQVSLPFTVFLNYLNLNEIPPETPSLYLAQEPLLQSFPELSDYLPMPEYVMKVGKGDIYATNIWMGRAGETNTPLHKDPNPNLFVQLAGRKRVRLFSPTSGRELMEYTGSNVERRFRTGDEMMVGKQKEGLDMAVWSENVEGDGSIEGFEAEVYAGDGLFIPKGWWHAIKGVGEGGVSASVNWWFR